MAGRECYHCKQWIEDGEAHDCWTTTEEALTQDLSEDLQEAYELSGAAASKPGTTRGTSTLKPRPKKKNAKVKKNVRRPPVRTS